MPVVTLSVSRVYVINRFSNDIRVSSDQGVTWETITPTGFPDFSTINFASIVANPFNTLEAIILGTNGQGIWRTTNGGYSFTQIASTAGMNFYSAWYIDGFNIVAVGDYIYRSSDGGSTFSSIGVSAATLYGLAAPNITAKYVHFDVAAVGYLSIYDKLFKSYDSGNTWTVANGGSEIVAGSEILGIRHSNSSDSVAVVVDGNGIYLSTDGGFSFALTLALATTMPGTFLTQNRFDTGAWLITSNQDIYYSPDSTVTWTLTNTYPNPSALYQGIVSFDPLNILVMGSDAILGDTALYTSSDAGITLTPRISYGNIPLNTGGSPAIPCGTCPPTFTFNSQKNLCQKITNGGPLCPPGYTYNQNTNTCLGATTYLPKDIVIARDNSSSIEKITGSFCDPAPPIQSEWNQMTLLQSDIVSGLNAEILAGDVQIGVVDWASCSNHQVTQGLTSTLVDINSAVCANSSYFSGTCYVGGLCDAYNELMFGPTNNPNAEKIILFFTDGVQNINTPSNQGCTIDGVYYTPTATNIAPNGTVTGSAALLNYAKAIKDQGIKVFLIALGEPSEINSIYNAYVDNPVINSGTQAFPSTDADGNLLYFSASFDDASTIVTAILDGLNTVESVPVQECDTKCTQIVSGGSAYCQCIEESSIIPCCYKLTDCAGIDAPIYTQANLSDYVDLGKIIKIQGSDTCWQVSLNGSICTSAVPVIVTEAFNDCATCSPSFSLYNCKDNEVVIHTDVDLSGNLGQTLTLDEYPGDCWRVGPNYTYVTPREVVTPDPITYQRCDQCDPDKYQLTNCYSNQSYIITNSDIGKYLNRVVNIDGVPGLCFKVTEVKCDCIKITIDGDDYVVNSTSTINYKNAYYFTFGLYNLSLVWDNTDSRWKITDTATDTVLAYSPIKTTCPFTSYWIITVEGVLVFSNISVSYCIDQLTDVNVTNDFPDCECCIIC